MEVRDFFILLGIANKAACLEKGEALWQELDKKLPKAVGVIKSDQPRVDMFKRMADKLPRAYRKCLKKWLTETVDSFWHNDSGDCSFLQKKNERKQWQIYKQHLEALG